MWSEITSKIIFKLEQVTRPITPTKENINILTPLSKAFVEKMKYINADAKAKIMAVESAMV